MARYLTIRAAGYLEAVRDDVADRHVGAKSASQVARRIRAGLRNGQGVAPTQICDFVKSFDPGWHSELVELLDADDQLLRSQLGALVSARKKIAHGDGETVTVSKALTWQETAQTIGSWLILRFDPNIAANKPLGI